LSGLNDLVLAVRTLVGRPAAEPSLKKAKNRAERWAQRAAEGMPIPS
jgi:hypothetical protein